MRILLGVGLILLILGIGSLFVPIPHRERHGFNAGPVSVGVTTTEREKVHPAVTVLIAGGVALMIAGGRKRS